MGGGRARSGVAGVSEGSGQSVQRVRLLTFWNSSSCETSWSNRAFSDDMVW